MGIDRWPSAASGISSESSSSSSESGSDGDSAAASSSVAASSSAAWSSSNGRHGRACGVGGAGGAQKPVVPASKYSQKASESATESDSDDNTQAGPPLKKANVEYAWECRICWFVNSAQAVACAACDTPRGSS